MKLEGHRTNRHLVLTPNTWAQLLVRVAANRDHPGGRELFVRLAGTWGRRPDRAYVTFRPTSQERQVLRDLTVIPSNGQVHGRTRSTKESSMARKASKAKPADDIDELEAELAQLEEVEIDEDDEDTEDEGVDLSSMTAAQLKVHAKGLGIKGTDKKNKAALIALIEAADDEEDEEDEEEVEDEVEEDEEEEEDDGLDEMSRAELKAHIKAEGLEVKVFKSDSDEDIVAKIREATGDDEEDEEEEEDEPAPKKAASKGKAKSTGKGGAKKGALGPRPLPAGRFGANDVAEAANTTALSVRNFLRSDKGQAWPINAELGRYSFTAKQVSAIVKAMASRPGAGPRGPRSKSTGKASIKKGTRK